MKQSSSQVVAYPLFAVADELAGAIGNQEQELQVAYTSPDAMDNGKTVDALVKITPEAP